MSANLAQSETQTEAQPRYRLDDLRRLATDLTAKVGLAQARGAALARYLLWFDAVGVTGEGIARLPEWLDRIEQRAFQLDSDGKIGQEHASTAQVSADLGLPPLVLKRAAEIAGQKARDTGLGLVRVSGLLPGGLATPFAAELAIGPQIGIVLGPGPEQAAALPTAEGLPLVYDSAFKSGSENQDQDPSNDSASRWLTSLIAPWSLLAEPGGVIVLALTVSTLEPLTSFQERVSHIGRGFVPGIGEGAHHPPALPRGWLAPANWESARRIAREQGVPLPQSVQVDLQRRAKMFDLPFPAPIPESG